jgi:hypothetical protein
MLQQTIDQAAMLPLDYTPTRRELSTVFMSPHWASLQELLTDPCRYLQAQGKTWPQVDNQQESDYPWKLLAPATALIRWVGESPETLVAARASLPLTFFTALGGGDGGSDGNGLTSDGILTLIRNVGANPQVVRDALDEVFPDGFYMADFALDTHTIEIFYHPAPVRKDDDGAPIRWYQGEFTNSVLIKVPSDGPGTNLPSATLHFDVGRDPAERAQFIMDYLEDWVGVVTEALHYPGREFLIGKADLVDRGQTIDIEPAKEGPIPEAEPSSPNRPFALIVVEGLSLPAGETAVGDGNDSCLVCVEVNGVYVPPEETVPSGRFVLGQTTVKCYLDPLGP